MQDGDNNVTHQVDASDDEAWLQHATTHRRIDDIWFRQQALKCINLCMVKSVMNVCMDKKQGYRALCQYILLV